MTMWFVTFRALVRIQGRKFGVISINERNRPMNNEQNKPTELTEKELEGIVGGGDFIRPFERQTGIKTGMTGEAELVEGGAVNVEPMHDHPSVTFLPESARRLR